MVRESQRPQVTQIQVRVDCNGCVQKIKKALNGINGIHDFRIDFHRQRLTIIGWADPEKVVKAIKKTKKNAIICSNIELASPSRPTEPEPIEHAPAPDEAQPLPAEAPPAQASPPSEPLPEARPYLPTRHYATQQRQNKPGSEDIRMAHMIQHHQPNYVNRINSAPTQHYTTTQQWQNLETEDIGQVHMTGTYVDHHHQPNHVNRFSSGHNYLDRRGMYHNRPVFLEEQSQPTYVTHSYNTHMPSPYVTEFEYVSTPSWHTHYNSMEHYNGDYQNGNVNITSLFSDDNPNACSIV